MTKKLFTGIDLHSNNLFIGVADQDGARVFHKRVPCELPQVLKVLKPFKERIAMIAVESTFNWYWLIDGLQDHGYPVVLANPAGMEQYSGLKHGDDQSDSFFLAEMLRLNILPTGHICDRALRPVRDMLRRRLSLVQKRTSLMLSLQSLRTRTLGQSVSQRELKKLCPEELTGLFADPADKLTCTVLARLQRELSLGIDELEKAVLKKVAKMPSYQVLQSLPGVGIILGLTITLETVDVNRFADAGNYASYCRCVDSKRISNGKKKGKGNEKCGNKYLAWAFVEAANLSKRYDQQCRAFFDKKAQATNKIVATKALACKLSKAAWHMMSTNSLYDPQRMFPGSAPTPQKTGSATPLGAPIGGDPASPLRVATGGDASKGSKGRRRRSPVPANKTARPGAGK